MMRRGALHRARPTVSALWTGNGMLGKNSNHTPFFRGRAKVFLRGGVTCPRSPAKWRNGDLNLGSSEASVPSRPSVPLWQLSPGGPVWDSVLWVKETTMAWPDMSLAWHAPRSLAAEVAKPHSLYQLIKGAHCKTQRRNY